MMMKMSSKIPQVKLPSGTTKVIIVTAAAAAAAALVISMVALKKTGVKNPLSRGGY